jgi:hypothetical protein
VGNLLVPGSIKWPETPSPDASSAESVTSSNLPFVRGAAVEVGSGAAKGFVGGVVLIQG